MELSHFMEQTLRMRNWAVVGASPKRDRASNQIVRELDERGFTVYPVRPATPEIEGLACYASLADVQGQIEVVDLVVNPEVGIRVMEQVRELGIKYVWVQPGAESDEIRRFAEKHDIVAVEACVLVGLRRFPKAGFEKLPPDDNPHLAD